MRTAVSRHAALVVATLALILSSTGWADAARKAVSAKLRPGATIKADRAGKVPSAALPFVVSSAPKAGALLRLGSNKRFPVASLPSTIDAKRLGGKSPSTYLDGCPDDTLDLGTWCLMTAVYSLDRGDVGKNDYAFATQACVARGGYLPSAGQLIGAADAVKLSSTIDDARLTASTDLDPSDGLKDQAEMSSTLITTASGASAAGSIGVTQGSTGDPKQGEPDPVPVPADPEPSTLQYVRVYDNHNQGGFAGSKPVDQPERFRCAFGKADGGSGSDIEQEPTG